jgi:hypothetical protein
VPTFLTSALDGSECWASCPGTHWIGGWVDLTACLDDLVERKMLSLPVVEPRPFSPSPSLYWLSHLGSFLRRYTFFNQNFGLAFVSCYFCIAYIGISCKLISGRYTTGGVVLCKVRAQINHCIWSTETKSVRFSLTLTVKKWHCLCGLHHNSGRTLLWCWYWHNGACNNLYNS